MFGEGEAGGGRLNRGEFVAWGLAQYGLRLEPIGTGSIWLALWGKKGAQTGSGYPATYTEVHQRRLAMWMRCRHVVAREVLADWLDASESHSNGWLVNDGTGIRWYETISSSLFSRLLRSGFVAIPCGTDD